eukprot:3786013-Prymnesium_polylepis.1
MAPTAMTPARYGAPLPSCGPHASRHVVLTPPLTWHAPPVLLLGAGRLLLRGRQADRVEHALLHVPRHLRAALHHSDAHPLA